MSDGDSIIDDADTGPPIDQLREVDLPVDDAFRHRVRQSINRHLLAGDLLELAWHGPLAAVLELLQAPFSWFRRGPRGEQS